ncbi:zinc-dependent metalloprotease [uncultured Algibacter sp.]|uniref:zinc-dependent metalloprotease n=1 Tax=uncultured Algibacter sp. TaxID=298659 RepID=UPI002622DA0C|nr:zinc-dependent metalloprotease [uncultured Algibacter sp.]
MKNIFLICFLSILNIGFLNSSSIYKNKRAIPNEASKGEGFLTSFTKGDQLYLSIPKSHLDKPMMFSRHDSGNQYEFMQVVWSLFKDKILLKASHIASTSGAIIPFNKNNFLCENILAVFPREKTQSNSKLICINITQFLLHQNIPWTPEFNENLVPQLSYLIDTKNLSNEVIISTQRGLVKNQSRISIPVYYSFYELPVPMKSRRFDYRMGFYDAQESAISSQTKNSMANISRWRLEKRDNDKKTNRPIKPITFILSPKIPEKWREYVKYGIEEWLPAFKSAGFEDAIVVKEVDSMEDWQLHSLNYSIVRWGNNLNTGYKETEGSTVSNVIDLRSGEILKSDIILGSSYEFLADQYFIRCAPLDKRAQRYPFPDDLMGELIQSLVAHEAGHTFGIMDNNYGEYSYPITKMNDRSWLEKMGHTPSIMTYARHNNIAQPEDNIPASLLIQKLGPTDHYYIKWGYMEFPNTFSNKEEELALEGFIKLQDSITWFRYNNDQFEIIGPAATNEVVENDSPMKSTRLALKNIERVIDLLPEVNRGQKDNARLERLYDKTLNLWHHQMRQVVSLIGGYDIYYKSVNELGNMYTPIALKRQEEALNYLISNAFSPPNWLTHPVFISKLSYSTYPDKMLEYQQALLFELLRPQRMKRFERMENLKGYENISRIFISNLQFGLFRELYENLDVVDPKRQEIQSTYIDKLIQIIEQKRVNMDTNKRFFDYTDYSKGMVLEQLRALEKQIFKRVAEDKASGSMGHWMLCLKKLNSIL